MRMDNAEVRRRKQLPSKNKFRKRRMFLHPSSLVYVTRECSRSNLQNLSFNYFTICFVPSLAASEESKLAKLRLEYSISRDILKFTKFAFVILPDLRQRAPDERESGLFDRRGKHGEAEASSFRSLFALKYLLEKRSSTAISSTRRTVSTQFSLALFVASSGVSSANQTDHHSSLVAVTLPCVSLDIILLVAFFLFFFFFWKRGTVDEDPRHS